MFQSVYCTKAFPKSTHILINETCALEDDEFKEFDFVYCPSEHLLKLKTKFLLATNIASMGEMNNSAINHYFNFLRGNMEKENYFYCCNRSYKELSGGEVTEFFKYPWLEADDYVIDEVCSWRGFFIGREKLKRGPMILGTRIPLMNYYDGEVRHRLANLFPICPATIHCTACT